MPVDKRVGARLWWRDDSVSARGEKLSALVGRANALLAKYLGTRATSRREPLYDALYPRACVLLAPPVFDEDDEAVSFDVLYRGVADESGALPVLTVWLSQVEPAEISLSFASEDAWRGRKVASKKTLAAHARANFSGCAVHVINEPSREHRVGGDCCTGFEAAKKSRGAWNDVLTFFGRSNPPTIGDVRKLVGPRATLCWPLASRPSFPDENELIPTWVVPRGASAKGSRGVTLMTITPSEGSDEWWGVSLVRGRSAEHSLLEALVLGFGRRRGVRAFSGTMSLDSVELQRAWLSWVATQPTVANDPDRSIERREHFTRALRRK